MQPKFDKITEKVNTAKQKAQVEFKKGAYAEAIRLYKGAAEILDIAMEDFSVFKREIAQQEAAIFGNIAFCYGKDQQERAQIEYSTKVIDRSLYIDNVDMLVKAYLRRGLAYEQTEKYKLAVNDLTRVRELQPMNKQAQQGIQRCQKYIRQDEGASYTPNEEDISLPDLPELKPKAPAAAPQAPTPVVEEVKQTATVEEVKVEEVAEPAPVAQEPESATVEEVPAETPAETPEEPAAADTTDYVELETKLGALKEKGNNQFRKKAFKEAIKHFSEAIKLYEDTGRPGNKGDIKTKVTQIYTNRATSLHMLN